MEVPGIGELKKGFGEVPLEADPHLGHHPLGLLLDEGLLGAGGVDLEVHSYFPGPVPEPALRHLAAGGVVGAKNQKAHPINLTFPRSGDGQEGARLG